MQTLKSLVLNFIANEQGSESTEVGVTTVVLAGGSAQQLTQLKGTIQSKVTTVNEALNNVDVN